MRVAMAFLELVLEMGFPPPWSQFVIPSLDSYHSSFGDAHVAKG